VYLLSAWSALTAVGFLFLALSIFAFQGYIQAFCYYVISISVLFGWRCGPGLKIVSLLFLSVAAMLYLTGVHISPLGGCFFVLLLATVSAVRSNSLGRLPRLAIIAFCLVVVEFYGLNRATVNGTGDNIVFAPLFRFLIWFTILRCALIWALMFLVGGAVTNWALIDFSRLWEPPSPRSFRSAVFVGRSFSDSALFLGAVFNIASMVVCVGRYLVQSIVNVGRYLGWFVFRVVAVIFEFILRVLLYLLLLFGHATITAITRVWDGILGALAVIACVLFSVAIPFLWLLCIAMFVERASIDMTAMIGQGGDAEYLLLFCNILALSCLVVLWIRYGYWFLHPGERTIWLQSRPNPLLVLDQKSFAQIQSAKQVVWNLVENWVIQRVMVTVCLVLTVFEFAFPWLKKSGLLSETVTPFHLGPFGIVVLLLLAIGGFIEVAMRRQTSGVETT
jgi:hypothetical protein